MNSIFDLTQREDIDSILIADHAVYLWIDRGIGHTGDLGPGLLRQLAEVSDDGHGVFTGSDSMNPPTKEGDESEPDIKILLEWRD